MSRARWLGLVLLAACGSPELPESSDEVARRGRFGSLRDLVLFERPDPDGGPFFLDRFEVTRADWHDYELASGRAPGPLPAGTEALPVTGMDLLEARAFAAWRLCRLPRLDEWWFAATADGRYEFPWGSKADASRANTVELGLGSPALVGTFESGRRGEGPYDLIGNAAEWTETVESAFFRADSRLLPDAELARWKLARTPALTVWLPDEGIAPGIWLVEAVSNRVAREVVGGDYLSSMEERLWRRHPRDRSPGQGIRLCSDPRSLCLSLAGHPHALAPAEREILVRLLRRKGHATVLEPAWRRAREDLASQGRSPGPLAAVLDAELLR